MNNNRTRSFTLAGLLIFLCSIAYGQVKVVSSDSLSCTVHTTTLTATVEYDNPTDAGIHIDDHYPAAANPIGFTFNFYGIPYTQCFIGPNGTISFNTGLEGSFVTWVATGPLLGQAPVFNSICGPWCDIDVSVAGSGIITYSTTGIAPNRKFIITFCHTTMFSCHAQWTTSQMVLHETSDEIEVFVGHKDICGSWYGATPGLATIGVQNADGTAATAAPGRDFAVFTCTNEGWKFVPDPGGASYSVSAIPYSPVPRANASGGAPTIYWYNATTGAYLGTGSTQVVSPSSPTLYRACAIGCSTTDTSNGYYLVRPGGGFDIGTTFTNPTQCGACDGSITISGMNPGAADTVNYTFNGVSQPTIYTTASSGGTVTISGLCAGDYDGFTVAQGCSSNPTTGLTLIDPPIAISSVSQVNPSVCGACDGSLTVHGLYPSHLFTINYHYNGVAQTPVSGTTDASGAMTFSGLCEGTYDNIVASFGTCITPPVGTYTLAGPPPPPAYVMTVVNPTECGLCNGSFTMKSVTPFSSDTISYSLNGVAQPKFVVSANADSSIYLPGLCAGNYTDISIKINNCIVTVGGGALIVDPPITSNFTNDTHLGCNGDTVFFHNLSTSTGALWYMWNFGDGTSDSAANPYHVYPAGTYTVTLTTTNHHCVQTHTTTFTLGHPLQAIFTESPNIVCQSDTVNFTNTSIGANAYTWYFGNGASDTASNPFYIYNKTGTYTVHLIASNTIPCYDTLTSTVNVDTISGMNITLTDTVFCAGTYITLQGLYAPLGNTGITWSFGDGDSIKNVNPVYHSFGDLSEYTITATAHYRACADASATRKVRIYPQPSIDLGRDTTICKGSEAMTIGDRVNAGNPYASWLWSTGQTTREITIVAPGTYYATVNVNNCYASDSIEVGDDCFMNIPNAFTPNGDGVNDYFFPRQLLTRGLTKFSMQIYNRWGQLIFETTSLDGAGWDGKLNNVAQPAGVYVYVMDATFRDGEKEHHQGNITLMR